MYNTNKIVNKILGVKVKSDTRSCNKTVIPTKCAYCGKELYFDNNDRNYVYSNAGEYVCKECSSDKNIKVKRRNIRR